MMFKNKKAEMLARDYMAVLILFGIVTGVGFLFISDMANENTGYNVTNMTDEYYQSRYDTLTNASKSIYLMSNDTASESKLVSTYTTMFGATFSVIGLVLSSFGLTENTLSYLMVDAGVPTDLGNLVGAGIIVILIGTLVFVIISSISRGKL